MADDRFFIKSGPFRLEELLGVCPVKTRVIAIDGGHRQGGEKAPDEKTPNGKAPDLKSMGANTPVTPAPPDEKGPDEKGPDEKTPDEKTPDKKTMIHDIAPLDTARAGDISFFSNRRYLDQFRNSRATACICRTQDIAIAPRGIILLATDDPHLAYARIAALFYRQKNYGHVGEKSKKSLSRRKDSYIHPDATIGENCHIGPGAIVFAGAQIGDHTIIGGHSVIEAGVVVGRHCHISSHVNIACSIIGDRVVIDSGVRIGQAGFGFCHDKDSGAYIDIPQVGRVLIGDRVHIGANTTIDRGSITDTQVKDGCRIDNLVQIAHNVILGKGCVIAAQVGIAGSASLGDFVIIGGQAGISGHLKIGNRVRIAAKSGVIRDIVDGGAVGGIPAVALRQWHRQSSFLSSLGNAGRASQGKNNHSKSTRETL